MTRQDAITRSIALKAHKEELKRTFIARNNDEQSTSSRDNNVLVFPAMAHIDTQVDWSFQWYANGFLLSTPTGNLLVDPGLDFYSRLTQSGYTINETSAIFISHKHVDHISELPILIDMLLRLGRKLDLIMPQEAFNKVLPDYLREILSAGSTINLILVSGKNQDISENISWLPLKSMCLVKLSHSARQTFGFKLKIGHQQLLYISDTGYAKLVKTDQGVFSSDATTGNFLTIAAKRSYIKKFAASATLAVVNVNDLSYNRHSYTHLSGFDIVDIFQNSALQQLILQHVSPYDSHGNDSKELYQTFFAGEPYSMIIPARKKLEVSVQ